MQIVSLEKKKKKKKISSAEIHIQHAKHSVLGPEVAVCMKCQSLFSRKKKEKNIWKCRLLKLLPSLLSINPCPAEPGYALPLQTM